MDNRNVALERAFQALSKLGLPAALPTLSQAGLRLRREILGGSHSVVTYPPIGALNPLDPRTVMGTFRSGTTAHLYIHIAFCETQCTFCHYAVELYRGTGHSTTQKRASVVRYLHAVKREMRMWADRLRPSGTHIASVYIGGGTPLVLEQAELGELLTTLCDSFTLTTGAEICVEGSPLTITAPGGDEKLRFLRNAGVTRFSFGVQSFDDSVLRYAARGYKRATAIEACRIVNDVFSNWNLDLIQGLYQGSTNEVWRNLQVLRELQPPHLTWYHGRFADRPQGDWIRLTSKQSGFEDEAATLLGRMLLSQELTDLGYRQIDGNRFVREMGFTDPFKKTRTSVASDLIGIGTSAYSHMAGEPLGWFVRNTPGTAQYIERIERDEPALATGRAMTAEEMLAASYVVGLRTGRTENVASVHGCSPELLDHYHELTARLLSLGVLERIQAEDGPTVRLTTLGRLFEDEVLTLFYSPTTQAILTKRG